MSRKIALYPFRTFKRLSARREIGRYLESAAAKRLNVGAQTNVISGWMNVDLLPFPGVTFMDATKRWLFPDDTFEVVLCEHMIEHVPKPAGEFLLGEAFRVIAPGGRVRIVTPDMTSFARLALGQDTPTSRAYLEVIGRRHPGVSRCDVVNMIYYGYGHRYIFSPEELSAMMAEAGFSDISETRAGYPADPAFEGAEGHPQLLGREENGFEAFALEATKRASSAAAKPPRAARAATKDQNQALDGRPAAAAKEAPTALAYARIPSSPRQPR
ncbi:MAG: methyltransferase domain-containing protein [Flavobacteriaceae bacterium]